MLNGERQGARFEFTSRLRIGTDPTNDIVLSDHTASPCDFEIFAEGAWARIRDLGSSSGVWINGVRAQEAVVRDIALINVGATTLQLHPKIKPSAAPTASGFKAFGELVGNSASQQRVFSVLEKASASNVRISPIVDSLFGAS